MEKPKIDDAKIMQVLLYVLSKLSAGDRQFHKIFKIIWFADLAHTKNYGRAITGDSYIKMEYGPVPSFLYDVLKGVRDGIPPFEKYAETVAVTNYKVKPLAEPDTDYLSASDIMELDKSIRENEPLSMGSLTDKSHGTAWKKSKDNKEIFIESILDELEIKGEQREQIIEYRKFEENFA